MLLTILFVLLLIALLSGGVGYSRFGYVGMSPAGVLLIVVAVLLLTGHRMRW